MAADTGATQAGCLRQGLGSAGGIDMTVGRRMGRTGEVVTLDAFRKK